MHHERTVTLRTLLKLASLTFGAIDVFVALVAYATGGPALLASPSAWYAVVAPASYAAVCALWAFGALEGRLSRPMVVGLHLLVLPALVFSLSGLGLLLPVLAVLWWLAAYGGRPAAGRPAA